MLVDNLFAFLTTEAAKHAASTAFSAAKRSSLAAEAGKVAEAAKAAKVAKKAAERADKHASSFVEYTVICCGPGCPPLSDSETFKAADAAERAALAAKHGVERAVLAARQKAEVVAQRVASGSAWRAASSHAPLWFGANPPFIT